MADRHRCIDAPPQGHPGAEDKAYVCATYTNRPATAEGSSAAEGIRPQDEERTKERKRDMLDESTSRPSKRLETVFMRSNDTGGSSSTSSSQSSASSSQRPPPSKLQVDRIPAIRLDIEGVLDRPAANRPATRASFVEMAPPRSQPVSVAVGSANLAHRIDGGDGRGRRRRRRRPGGRGRGGEREGARWGEREEGEGGDREPDAGDESGREGCGRLRTRATGRRMRRVGSSAARYPRGMKLKDGL
ncbi:hypothetical protein NUW54_g9797 [Trametes sanguinea]|uniref:Uncharacterized protein n=1 Tax=Trametes sanguinea TaxID=158606 RepID=A0ACC1P661_9APHY|nr:hypothetical protein NUW54_g9797 [Trametes sanguinea]